MRLSLQSLDGRSIPNVALTDLLPAGFEIGNPRLSAGRELPWVKTFHVPEHTDIRDEQLNIYTSAKPQVQHFYYQVRALTKGTFQMVACGCRCHVQRRISFLLRQRHGQHPVMVRQQAGILYLLPVSGF